MLLRKLGTRLTPAAKQLAKRSTDIQQVHIVSHYLNIYVNGKRKILQSVIQKKEWMTTILEISKPSSISPSSKKKKTEEIQRVSELCFVNIWIIHFDRWMLISFPRSFVSADYKRPVSIAMQATKKRLSKGSDGLSS